MVPTIPTESTREKTKLKSPGLVGASNFQILSRSRRSSANTVEAPITSVTMLTIADHQPSERSFALSSTEPTALAPCSPMRDVSCVISMSRAVSLPMAIPAMEMARRRSGAIEKSV